MFCGALWLMVLLKVVRMNYAKLKKPLWRIGIIRIRWTISVMQIRDIILLVFVILVLLVLLTSPIWLAFYMPTGT